MTPCSADDVGCRFEDPTKGLGDAIGGVFGFAAGSILTTENGGFLKDNGRSSSVIQLSVKQL